MRHSVSIMFGKRAESCLLTLHKYILRFGGENIENFFRSYLYCYDEDGVTLKQVVVNEEGELTLGNATRWSTSEALSEIPVFIQSVHGQMINIQNKPEFRNLHLCLYVPLLEDIKQVSSFISAIEKGGFNYVDIDTVCLSGDLCKALSGDYEGVGLLELQKRTGEGLKQLVDYRKKHPILQHLLAIQDYQNGGVALSLQLSSLTRILGEFSLMVIENYTKVFGSVRSESDFQTMGVSMLQLDKFYFSEYLLRKTLKQIAEKENISQDSVDINMASTVAHDVIKPWIHLLSETYRNEIKAAFDRKESEMEIIAGIDQHLQKRFEQMQEDLESYMSDESLSLPAKKAILSAILGQDDPLFVNALYDEDVLTFQDLEQEAIEQFTTTNNYILEHEEHLKDAILSTTAEKVEYPIEEMRKNRIRLIRAIGYIRDLEKEQVRLEQQMDAQEHARDCFIENGFVSFGERKYKLLPQVTDEPLKEHYSPHTTTLTSVDLSGQMPPIKDQGEQGACLAFSLTSVFEYLYKRKTHQDIDLSEQFLYYISREKVGEEGVDDGSHLQPAVDSLAEKGICVEEKWRYGTKETAFDIHPSEAAFQDALDRKLSVAKNVALDVNAIRSALADGYPVVFSTKLYDSFSQSKMGFVTLPTDEERGSADSTTDRNHAMVICGYNDEAKIFKVRNSWGKDFGLGGYVYMPYSYITDSTLTNFAVVLMEIELAKTITEKIAPTPVNIVESSMPRLEFDRDDTKIQYGINKILIDETHEEIHELKKIDQELSTYCLNLKQKLKNSSIRQQMCKAATECYQADIQEKEDAWNATKDQKSEELTSFERDSRRSFIKYGVIALLLTAFFCAATIIERKCIKKNDTYCELMETCKDKSLETTIDPFDKKKEISVDRMSFKTKIYQAVIPCAHVCHKWWIVLICYSVLGGCFLIFFINYRKRLRSINEEYDEKLDQLSREKGVLQKALNELRVKFHLAGSMLTQFFTINDLLEKKARVLESFILNTKSLAADNNQKLSELSPNVQPPFIPMLNNEDLDNYFRVSMGELTQETRLFHFLEGYSICDEAFTSFRETLKKKMDENVSKLLDRFSIYKYMSGKEIYSYLPSGKRQVSDFLVELDNKSEVFMLCNDTISRNPSKTLYVHTDENEETTWQNTYKRAFSIPPVSVNIESKFKIILIRLLDLDLKQIEWFNS